MQPPGDAQRPDIKTLHQRRQLSFVLSRVGANQSQQPEWQLQQQPLGARSAVREAELPAALADGSFGGGGSGSADGRASSVSGQAAAEEPAAQVPIDFARLAAPSKPDLYLFGTCVAVPPIPEAM